MSGNRPLWALPPLVNRIFSFSTSIFNGLPHSFAAGAICLDPFGILRQDLIQQCIDQGGVECSGYNLIVIIKNKIVNNLETLFCVVHNGLSYLFGAILVTKVPTVFSPPLPPLINRIFPFSTSIFNDLRHSFAAGSPGAVCSDPFGILRQVLLHHPRGSDEWGEKMHL